MAWCSFQSRLKVAHGQKPDKNLENKTSSLELASSRSMGMVSEVSAMNANFRQ